MDVQTLGRKEWGPGLGICQWGGRRPVGEGPWGVRGWALHTFLLSSSPCTGSLPSFPSPFNSKGHGGVTMNPSCIWACVCGKAQPPPHFRLHGPLASVDVCFWHRQTSVGLSVLAPKNCSEAPSSMQTPGVAPYLFPPSPVDFSGTLEMQKAPLWSLSLGPLGFDQAVSP